MTTEPKNYKIRTEFEYGKADEMSEQETKLQKIYDAVSHPIDADTVYMHSTNYKKIFGKSLNKTNRKRRFIKITNVQTGDSVYRTFRGLPSGVLGLDMVYMDSDGKYILQGSDDAVEVSLAFRKACWFSYYWNTSNTMVRVTFKLGIVSLVVSLVSFFCSFFLG